MDQKLTQILLIEDDAEYAQLIHALLFRVKDTPFNLEHISRLSIGLERLAEGDVDVMGVILVLGR